MASKEPASASKKRNSRLANVIEKNIHIIVNNREMVASQRTAQEKIADTITRFTGRMKFVYFHAVWFGAWMLLNTGLFGIEPFDPFPFGLLTMIVSLEAIFITAFVLISQERFSAEAESRADLHLHIGLLTEHELTRALKMLDAMQNKLGIENETDPELRELEEDVHPEDVLNEIKLVQERIGGGRK